MVRKQPDGSRYVLPFLLSYSNRTIGKNAWFTLLTLCVLRGQGRRLLRTGRSTSSWLPCPVYIAAIQAGLCNWGYPVRMKLSKASVIFVERSRGRLPPPYG